MELNFGSSFMRNNLGPIHVHNSTSPPQVVYGNQKYVYHTASPPAQDKLGSIIAKIAPLLSSANEPTTEFAHLAQVKDKIEFNQIKRFKRQIESYADYGSTVESILEEIDNHKTSQKSKIKNYFMDIYFATCIDMLPSGGVHDASFVRANSDEILENISTNVTRQIREEANLENVGLEELQFAVNLLICYAFIACKIMEKPSK